MSCCHKDAKTQGAKVIVKRDLYHAAPNRPRNYIEKVMSFAIPGTETNESFEIPLRAWHRLRRKYQRHKWIMEGNRVLRGAIGLTRSKLGIGIASNKTIAVRLQLCESCDRLTEERRCSVCSCWVDHKIQVSSETCPLGHW